jgi:hypothetical protein
MYCLYLSLFSEDHTPVFTKRLDLEEIESCITLSSIQSVMRKNNVQHSEFKSDTVRINISKNDVSLRFLDPPSYSWANIDKINFFILENEKLVEKEIRAFPEGCPDENESENDSQNQDKNDFNIKNIPDFERDREERREEFAKEKNKRNSSKQNELFKKRENNKLSDVGFWMKNTGISWKKNKKGKAWIFPGKGYWECKLIHQIEEDNLSQISFKSGLTTDFERMELKGERVV